MKKNKKWFKINLSDKKYSFFKQHLKNIDNISPKQIIDFFGNLENSDNDFNVTLNNNEIKNIKNEYFQFSEFVSHTKFNEFDIDEVISLIFYNSPDIIVVTHKRIFAIELFSLCDRKFHNNEQKIVCYDQLIIGEKENNIVNRHLKNYDKYLKNIKSEFGISSNEMIKIIYFVYAIDNDEENASILEEKFCNHFNKDKYSNVSWYIKVS